MRHPQAGRAARRYNSDVATRQTTGEVPASGGWLRACRVSALAAVGALWLVPGAFFHFEPGRDASRGIGLVFATFPYFLALLWLMKNPPRQLGLELAAGLGLTAMIFIAGSYARVTRHAEAAAIPTAGAALAQLAFAAAAIQCRRPLARAGDYGSNFLARTMLAIYFSGMCFVAAAFFTGAVK